LQKEKKKGAKINIMMMIKGNWLGMPTLTTWLVHFPNKEN
jgi:hypothetical protein